MVSSFGCWFPRKSVVKFDATERGMLEKLGRITGFTEEELVRKAVRRYYSCFLNGFNARVMVDEVDEVDGFGGESTEVKANG